ncbi:hypothetical protein DL546_001696 [Coniochaeta pulveracea]|uniref:Uncharacterized protein n=1 Tax=Coniochaeta pulveracea TaxID=177199 RepID=A0A420XY39_9PEZI|nr:hypothetical protein DL546_001696 [Coniochaeta pulveracea]
MNVHWISAKACGMWSYSTNQSGQGLDRALLGIHHGKAPSTTAQPHATIAHLPFLPANLGEDAYLVAERSQSQAQFNTRPPLSLVQANPRKVE